MIVAGGSGKRMSSEIPKQFIKVNEKPLLMHTFDAFLKSDENFEFILTLPETEIPVWKKLCEDFSFNQNHIVIPGGETRFHSVKNGLKEIEGDGIVFIHDGVRPLVSVQTIKNCYDTAVKKGNALPVIPVSESVRKITGSGNRAVDRSELFLVQTPQTFSVKNIKKAYEQEYQEKFTDDASVFESSGNKIYTVKGNRENIKITWPADLKIAGALLKS